MKNGINMKGFANRIAALACALALLLSSAALADGGWTCPACGEWNVRNFCPKDGTRIPAGAKPHQIDEAFLSGTWNFKSMYGVNYDYSDFNSSLQILRAFGGSVTFTFRNGAGTFRLTGPDSDEFTFDFRYRISGDSIILDLPGSLDQSGFLSLLCAVGAANTDIPVLNSDYFAIPAYATDGKTLALTIGYDTMVLAR